MISERSFTLQGVIENLSTVGKTQNGEDIQKFIVRTVETTGNSARFEVIVKGKSVPYISNKLRKGAICRVNGNLWSSYKKALDRTTGQERTFYNYTLYADKVVVDQDAEVVHEAPQELQHTGEAQLDSGPNYSIDSDELPF